MKCSRDEIIDGVRVVRRGGFFMVYFWAFVYYLFNFRGNFDVIIDSENGIPFFSPLFSRVPVYLLIHHVHQEVFTKYLSQPFGSIAKFLEAKAMPFVYRRSEIITISDSTLNAIRQLGLTNRATIVSPGINTHLYRKQRKTTSPSVLYLGRLRPYKHVDIAIRAFSKILDKIPSAHMTIAGSGVSYPSLKRLVKQLHIEKAVSFKGKVSETEKATLLSTHWVMVQPSMIEGWGITVIEANASGTVVVASNAPGLRDSVVNGTTGLLAEPLDVNSFFENINHLLSNRRLRLKMQKHAIAWSSRFNWDTSAEVGIQALTRKREENFPPLQFRPTPASTSFS
jgi:glycosyltransferase involved in cell wall biosynthesis